MKCVPLQLNKILTMTNNPSPAPGARIPFIDYIRVIACFMVLLVHSSENFYAADSSGLAGNVSMLANEANRFWVAFYDGGVSRTCVPLFMIVSAFLLVPMKPGLTMSHFYRHRFMRIMPPLICFLLLYTFLPLTWGGMTWEQSMADLRRLPFNFPSMAGHLWFMYPLISLYIIIPVVSPWLERSSAKDERIFLGFFALSTLVPWLHRFVTPELWGECFWNQFGALWYCSGFLGYLVLAHYIHYHIDWSRHRRLTVGRNVLPRRSRLHGLVVLAERCSRPADRDADAGMVVGVLYAERGRCHLRSFLAFHLHPRSQGACAHHGHSQTDVRHVSHAPLLPRADSRFVHPGRRGASRFSCLLLPFPASRPLPLFARWSLRSCFPSSPAASMSSAEQSGSEA
jgi:hypothetical protein